jgi:PKHD-type hydroxylase
MISNYLKSKNIIEYIKSPIDNKELNKDYSDGFYYLNSYPHSDIYYYYENLFDDNELDLIKAIGNRLPKENGSVGNSSDPEVNLEIRNSNVSWIGVNNETKWIYEKLTRCIVDINQHHFKYDLEKVETLQFTRYFGNSNGFYSCHIDSSPHNIPPNRKLSFVLQLSGPEEYIGGELRMYVGKDPTCIKKQKGLITFFPSYVLHECTHITEGERYVIVGWVHGPPFK